jgi:hypothetical protein
MDNERPLPFVLRVAGEWVPIEKLPDHRDEVLLLQSRANLTGSLCLTAGGTDVQFSDIGLIS